MSQLLGIRKATMFGDPNFIEIDCGEIEVTSSELTDGLVGKRERDTRKTPGELVHETSGNMAIYKQGESSQGNQSREAEHGFFILQMGEKKYLLSKSLSMVLCYGSTQKLIFLLFIS